jgi:hypothetical protein
LFVGGADPRKNHRLVLEAASLIRPHLEGRTLILVGSPTHSFGSYEATAKSYGLSDRVLCPGRLSQNDLQLLYSYADLFLFPSEVRHAGAGNHGVWRASHHPQNDRAGRSGREAALLNRPHNARFRRPHDRSARERVLARLAPGGGFAGVSSAQLGSLGTPPALTCILTLAVAAGADP